MSFQSLGLGASLVRAVDEQGYTQPTPIQQQAIPVVLKGRDVLASAQTGTGKTAGFTLPLLQRLSATPGTGHPRALVLTPTRELAAQVADSVKTYGQYLSLRSTVVYGGVKIGPQIRRLRQGIDVLVATPGRLMDHLQQGTVDLGEIEIVVLDECDRMLDMGFIHDIRRLLAVLPDQRQTLMFSATFSREIQRLAQSLLQDPERISVAPTNTTAQRVEQVVHPVDRHRKRELLSHMIGFQNWSQVLVFTRTKHGANRLAEQLSKDGLRTAAIHGNKSQAARTRALAEFKQGKVRVLVATDIASRGIDIDQLPYVVNYELPNVAEDYVHRIGRTGRAGNGGKAVTLVCDDEYPLLKKIERLIRQPLTQDVIPGYEPSFSPQNVPTSATTEPRRGGPSSGPKRRRPRRSGAKAGPKSGPKTGAKASSKTGANKTGPKGVSKPVRKAV